MSSNGQHQTGTVQVASERERPKRFARLTKHPEIGVSVGKCSMEYRSKSSLANEFITLVYENPLRVNEYQGAFPPELFGD